MPRQDKRIDEITREEGEYFVYLKPGHQLNGAGQGPENAAHCFGESTKREIHVTMRRVTSCSCQECKKLIAATT